METEHSQAVLGMISSSTCLIAATFVSCPNAAAISVFCQPIPFDRYVRVEFVTKFTFFFCFQQAIARWIVVSRRGHASDPSGDHTAEVRCFKPFGPIPFLRTNPTLGAVKLTSAYIYTTNDKQRKVWSPPLRAVKKKLEPSTWPRAYTP